MDTPMSSPSRTVHPLLIAAAIAVILFCTVGIAAIMGWIPDSTGRNSVPFAGTGVPAGATAPPAPISVLPPSALVQQSSQMLGATAPAPHSAPAPSYATASVAPATVARDRVRSKDEPAARTGERRRVAAAPERSWCSNCGNIESVRKVTTRARGSGVGAAGGAVLGGLLGNQIGGGRGRDLATVAGAVGGAVIGNQVEGNMKATTSYEVRVRLDDGSARTFIRETAPPWRTGERVRIVNGGIRAIN